MVAATYTVQADFSGTAYGGSPTWTDITSYVLTTGEGSPIQITFGRQDESSDVSPSTCSLTLQNDDGRFTPGKASGAYYPHLLPGVRVRVSDVVSGTTYDRFDGYVDSWEVQIGASSGSTCAVSATDILARMGTDQPLRSLWDETVLLGSPNAFYLPDDIDVGTADISVNRRGTLITYHSVDGGGSVDFSADDGVTLTGAGSQGYRLQADIAGVARQYVGFHGLWFRTTAAQVQTMLSFDGLAILRMDATGHVIDYAGNTSIKVYNDGLWHFAACEINVGVGAHTWLYTETETVGSTTGGAFSPGTVTATVRIGSQTDKAGYFNGSIRHVMIDFGQSIADELTAEATTFAGEATDAHVTRLLSYRANAGSSLDTGDGTVGAHSTAGETLQQALLDTGKAEGGVLYADGQGRIVLKKRSRTYNATSALTLSAATQQVAVDTGFRMDAQGLVNDMTASRPNGADQRVTDATSQATYGIRAASDTYIVNSDRDAADIAGWIVGSRKDPDPTSPNVTVDLKTEPSTTIAANALTAAPLTRISLTNLPATAPATSMDLIVEGWTETIGVDEWSLQFFTSPVPPTTLRADASASAYTKLDAGLLVPR